MKTKEELIEKLSVAIDEGTIEGMLLDYIDDILEAHDREKPANPWDDIIFHPDDPRAVKGHEYEFSNYFTFESFATVKRKLANIDRYSMGPFEGYIFIRPVRKPALKLDDILAKLTPEEAEFLVKAKSPWVEIKSHVDLPPVDEYVLWQYENGDVRYFAIDKDSDSEEIKNFLGGNQYTGPIIRWMRVPE